MIQYFTFSCFFSNLKKKTTPFGSCEDVLHFVFCGKWCIHHMYLGKEILATLVCLMLKWSNIQTGLRARWIRHWNSLDSKRKITHTKTYVSKMFPLQLKGSTKLIARQHIQHPQVKSKCHPLLPCLEICFLSTTFLDKWWKHTFKLHCTSTRDCSNIVLILYVKKMARWHGVCARDT